MTPIKNQQQNYYYLQKIKNNSFVPFPHLCSQLALHPRQQDSEGAGEAGRWGGVSEQGCQLCFLSPSLMAALSKYYFPFEGSDHIPPSPKTNFCESPQPRHCLVTIFCHLAFRVFPHWMTDGVATAHLVPKVCSLRTSRWAWQPATGAIKVREKEESESLSAPNPANPFSFLERFPFFNLPFAAATSCYQPEQICNQLPAHPSKLMTVHAVTMLHLNRRKFFVFFPKVSQK